MTYYANFLANNSTTYAKSIKSNNKATLIRDIRKIAEGNRFIGFECRWWVENEEGETIAAGGITRWGQRFRSI